MASPDATKIAKSIDDNTTQLKKLVEVLVKQSKKPLPKPINFEQHFTPPPETNNIVINQPIANTPILIMGEQLVIHLWQGGVPACRDIVLVDPEKFTLTKNRDFVNCPTCITY